jgi:hypothetical protein
MASITAAYPVLPTFHRCFVVLVVVLVHFFVLARTVLLEYHLHNCAIPLVFAVEDHDEVSMGSLAFLITRKEICNEIELWEGAQDSWGIAADQTAVPKRVSMEAWRESPSIPTNRRTHEESCAIRGE